MRGFAFLASWRGYLGAIAVSLLCPLSAQAIPSIIVGPTPSSSTYNLLPNTSGQTINIYVNGGGTIGGNNSNQVSGEDFALTIQDGDTGGGFSGGGPAANPAIGPAITFVTIIGTGTLFNGNNTGMTTPIIGMKGQYYITTTDDSTGPITITGTAASPQLLATVTIDTTGINSGSFSISARGTYDNGTGVDTQPTDFPPVNDNEWNSTPNPNYVDGTINIVPEPASLGLLGLAIPALLLRRRPGQVKSEA